MKPATLSERIKARDGNVVVLRRQPVWIRRMQEGKLPAKDMTPGKGAA